MTTAFTLNSAMEVKDLGYNAIKVASYDCASYPLIEELKKHWSRIFVSTGATFDHEIAKTSQILEGTDYHLLHCITIYPTPLEELHLNRMKFLKKYSPKVGFSDHTRVETTKLWASKLALALGASCVERHFTVLSEDQTKDGPVSITPELLSELSEFSKLSSSEMQDIVNREYPDWKQSLGQETRELSKS